MPIDTYKQTAEAIGGRKLAQRYRNLAKKAEIYVLQLMLGLEKGLDN